MSEEEYRGFYTKKSEALNKTPETIIAETAKKHSDLQNKVQTPMEDRPEPAITSSSEPETLDEVLTPRVMQIVANLNQPVEEGKEIVLTDVVEELESLKLTLDDLEYVRSQGKFKTIKRWAGDKVLQIEDSSTLSAEEIVTKVNPEISNLR
jgi:hypothetical protein